MDVNPILIEVFKNRFASICEEMGMTLMRTGFSPNIKERRDFSCALFDAQGEMIAQAAHIPVHLGSMPLSVQAAIAARPMERGDMVILNDPFKGGTHLPDITLVAPVFADDAAPEPSFYVANRAHHADVGGISAGSMPLSTSIFQEGIIIPPLTFVKGGEIVEPLLTFFLNNLRTPQEREGDFAAQVMANVTGVKRAQELIAKYGLDVVQQYSDVLMDYAETVTRAAIARIPDGEYEFEDFLDNDGITDELVPIRCVLTVDGETAELDFSASGEQVQGSVNAVRAITLSAVLYVFRALITENISTNAGCLRPLTVVTRPGTIVDAQFPAAVAGGNVETSQRIVDVILGALAQAMPEAVPAASQGTMNNITIGGFDPHKNRPFAYYETLGGGMGASVHAHGESAVHSHMTNTLNTPVEAMEYAYPFLVREYSVRRGSGGSGTHAGGCGMVREIELTANAEVTVLSERRRIGPYGLQGGEAGIKGANIIVRTCGGKEEREEKPGKFNARLNAGDRIRMETPGGGGWGE
ncbi:hydantoinase B/oxoprolinase family protein [Oceanidesulfovibrio indonesiensis]|uniref:Hydantoinase B/oxoprolinase family protein n=1 Tax=Oceanidesulfovibrio indonesiensis TaxID=54767 RepID=A0A7M3MIN6_9BACT|nr:hydantoinase B/oxoprolinase family protein [Oceanidesulfovibrio indonesiensis]TVM19669.1 hydantoinase B/oxoprolinase family protein [Oceanidesulfovibrio indonesiensis]